MHSAKEYFSSQYIPCVTPYWSICVMLKLFKHTIDYYRKFWFQLADVHLSLNRYSGDNFVTTIEQTNDREKWIYRFFKLFNRNGKWCFHMFCSSTLKLLNTLDDTKNVSFIVQAEKFFLFVECIKKWMNAAQVVLYKEQMVRLPWNKLPVSNSFYHRCHHNLWLKKVPTLREESKGWK